MTTAAYGYRHDVLLYESDDELVASAVPFLRDALNAGEPAVLVCTDRNAGLLAAALDGDSRLSVLDQSAAHRRVPAAITTYRQIVERKLAAGAFRVRLVGEAGAGFAQADWIEWARFEAVVNAALEQYPLWQLCIYDRRRLPPEVLAVGELTHPYLVMGTSRIPNPRYVDPSQFLRTLPRSQPDPLERTEPAIDVSNPPDLRQLRQEVKAVLAKSAVPPDTVSGLVFAVSEAVTNAFTHGQPPVRVRLWTSPVRSVCTVTDQGSGFEDPMTGYLAARRDEPGREGLGLWLTRQVCDHVTAYRTPDGFTLRIATRH